MNAQEAAALATKVVTTEQKTMADKAMTEIRREAERGHTWVTLYPSRPDWLKTYLEGEGYTATIMHSGDQRDSTGLRVSW